MLPWRRGVRQRVVVSRAWSTSAPRPLPHNSARPRVRCRGGRHRGPDCPSSAAPTVHAPRRHHRTAAQSRARRADRDARRRCSRRGCHRPPNPTRGHHPTGRDTPQRVTADRRQAHRRGRAAGPHGRIAPPGRRRWIAVLAHDRWLVVDW